MFNKHRDVDPSLWERSGIRFSALHPTYTPGAVCSECKYLIFNIHGIAGMRETGGVHRCETGRQMSRFDNISLLSARSVVAGLLGHLCGGGGQQGEWGALGTHTEEAGLGAGDAVSARAPAGPAERPEAGGPLEVNWGQGLGCMSLVPGHLGAGAVEAAASNQLMQRLSTQHPRCLRQYPTCSNCTRERNTSLICKEITKYTSH